MQDQQTDTYWSLMQGKALAGELKGETLQEIPAGEKTTWKNWRAKHPNTQVLSVNQREDGRNAYGGYFTDDQGFRGITAKDTRLATKAPIYAFHRAGKAYAIPYAAIIDGKAFALPGGEKIFLFRAAEDSILQSTSAFLSNAGFSQRDGTWVEIASQSTFDVAARKFHEPVDRIGGFDTYWYNWSLNNPETQVYIPGAKDGSGSKP